METITSEQPTVPAEAGQADAAEPVVPRPLAAARRDQDRAAEGVDQKRLRLRRAALLRQVQPVPRRAGGDAHLRRLLPDLQRRLLRQRPDRRRARPQAPEEALPAAGRRRALGGHGEDDRAGAGDRRDRARLRHRQLAGRADGGRLRRRPGGLQPRPQAGRDHRRDDPGRPLHPPRRRRRQRRRRPRLGVADPLHRHARRLPRLHQAPPGGGLRAAPGDQRPARSSSTTRSPSSTRWSPWSPPGP